MINESLIAKIGVYETMIYKIVNKVRINIKTIANKYKLINYRNSEDYLLGNLIAYYYSVRK